MSSCRQSSTYYMIWVVFSVCPDDAMFQPVISAAISLGRSTVTLPTPTPASISSQSILCTWCFMASSTLESFIALVRSSSTEECAAAFQGMVWEWPRSKFTFCVNMLHSSPVRQHQGWILSCGARGLHSKWWSVHLLVSTATASVLHLLRP